MPAPSRRRVVVLALSLHCAQVFSSVPCTSDVEPKKTLLESATLKVVGLLFLHADHVYIIQALCNVSPTESSEEVTVTWGADSIICNRRRQKITNKIKFQKRRAFGFRTFVQCI